MAFRTATASGDRRLTPLWQERASFDLLSVDLFDTLILRRCGAADDLFLPVADRVISQGLVADGIDRWHFRALRRYAGHQALLSVEKEGRQEATLHEIYRFLPQRRGAVEALVATEEQVEEEICTLNPAVVSLIHALLAEEKQIVILSDSWHSASFLKRLLTSMEFPYNRLTALISSADEGLVKRNRGDLYGRLAERVAPLRRGRIHHLGDQPLTDGANARRAGLAATIYQAEPEVARLSEWQRVYHPAPLPPLQPLQRLAAHLSPASDQARLLGSMVIGPALSCAARMAVDICRRRGIEVLWGLLREGGLLARLVEREAAWQGVGLMVEEVAISRQTTAALADAPLDRGSIESVCRRHGLTVGELWTTLGHEPPAEWLPDAGQPLAGLDLEQREELIGLLLAPDRLAISEAYRRQQADNLRGYVAQQLALHPGRRLATIDFGWGATIQRAIEPLLRTATAPPIHLLLLGDRRLFDARIDGLELHTLLGDPLDPAIAPMVQTIYQSSGVLEQLLSGCRASVTGYRLIAGNWQPVGERDSAVEADDPFRSRLVEAIFDYQQLEHQCGVADGTQSRTTALRELQRLIDHPAPEEAAAIGAIRLEHNFGTLSSQPICPPEPVAQARQLGSQRFLTETAPRAGYAGVVWPQGCATLADPAASLSRILKSGSDSSYLVTASSLITSMLECGIERLWVYGAGEIGQAVIRAASLSGIAINGIIDSNQLLHGSMINGHPVAAKETLYNQRHIDLVIASVAHGDAIAEEIGRWSRSEQLDMTIWRFEDGDCVDGYQRRREKK